MRFNILTLFPEFFESPLSCGLLAKAREQGLVDFSLVNPRDFTTDNHRTVDDRPYGGGPGMVMMLDPLRQALDSLDSPGRILMLTPGGKPLDQSLARELAQEKTLTLVCGRYEGIDARLAELYDIEPVSVGDFVLSGGESAALCLIEATGRLLEGFMGHEGSGEEESFSQGLLEYPHYTRPPEYEGLRVPEVLTSGDHARIAAWRREQSLAATLRTRPELLASAPLSKSDGPLLKNISNTSARKRPGRNLFLALVHYPVVTKEQKTTAVSLTNLDLHDISRCSRAFGLGGFYVTTPLEDQRRLIDRLLGHWLAGAGQKANPDRAHALALVKVRESLQDAVEDITASTGVRPRLVATSARVGQGIAPAEVRETLEHTPVLLVFGTASGLAKEVMDMADGCLRPLRYLDDYNHFSVRSAVSIYLDRLLGDVF